MKVKAREDFEWDGEALSENELYECKVVNSEIFAVISSRGSYLYFNSTIFKNRFDIINAPISGANSTPEEIYDQLINTVPDPLKAACEQIAALAQANHKLISRVHGCEGIVIELERRLEQVKKITEEMKPLMASVKSK